MDRKRDVHLVKDILPEVIRGISRRDIQEQISLERLWQDIARDDAGHAVITGFKDGCVFVQVDSPARLFRMRLRKPALLAGLKAKRKDIENISFKIGHRT